MNCENVAKLVFIPISRAVHPTENKTKISFATRASIPWNKGNHLYTAQSWRIKKTEKMSVFWREKQVGKLGPTMDKWRIQESKSMPPMPLNSKYSFYTSSISKESQRMQLLQHSKDFINFDCVSMKREIQGEDTKIAFTDNQVSKWTRVEKCQTTKEPKRKWNPILYLHRYDKWTGNSTAFLFPNHLKDNQKKQRLAELLSRQIERPSIDLYVKRNEKLAWNGNKKSGSSQNGIEMRKGTGGYEPLPKQSNNESNKEKQPEKKSSVNKKKASSTSENQPEPQHRRRIVSYSEDGNIIFERDLQPGEDYSVALEEWNEERSNLNSTVVEAMNPELDWEQNDVEEKQTTASKRIPKWIADDVVDFDENDEERQEEEEEEEDTTTDDLFPSPRNELEEEEAI